MAKRISILLVVVLFLTGCDYSKSDNRAGVFYNTFVQPMDKLLHLLGRLFNENYGLAIITIVLIVRFILLPFMLIQVKNMHIMREKTKVVQPQIDKIREKIKNASS
ncbi:YidC/Oxa1 family membrane protein insertase, partial [Enterococcus faecalis]